MLLQFVLKSIVTYLERQCLNKTMTALCIGKSNTQPTDNKLVAHLHFF